MISSADRILFIFLKSVYVCVCMVINCVDSGQQTCTFQSTQIFIFYLVLANLRDYICALVTTKQIRALTATSDF